MNYVIFCKNSVLHANHNISSVTPTLFRQTALYFESSFKIALLAAPTGLGQKIIK